MLTHRGRILLWLLLFTAQMVGPAPAQTYPDRPIRIIVPYNAGGGTDTLTRTLARKLQDILGQPVVVENRGGGNTIIATEYVSRQEPDGYTLLLATTIFTVNPTLVGKLPYDTLADFTPVVVAGIAPTLLVARPGLPVTSVKGLVDYGHAHPGKLSYGSPEVGTAPSLAAELLRIDAKIDAVNVPYHGTQPQLLALLSGDIDYAFDLVSSLEYVKTGRLKALAVADSKRLDSFPAIPTMAEAGFPGFEAATWYGFVVRTGTPADIVRRLNQAFNQAIADPTVREPVGSLGIRLLGGSSEEFGRRIDLEINKWASVLGKAGLNRRDR